MGTNDPRQPAYDAVYREIQREGHIAALNAFAWRCVHAALNAANVGIPVDPQTGQRFADEPTGLIDNVEIDPEELERLKAYWRKQQWNPQTATALLLGAEIEPPRSASPPRSDG